MEETRMVASMSSWEMVIEEINALHVEGMPTLKSLNALVGQCVNGTVAKFLDD